MKFTTQSIADVIIIEPAINKDRRGYFIETYKKTLFDDFLGYKVNFIQDNESRSTKGVLRGLHYQEPPYSQAKLVRVIEGNVLDIAVDIRKSSHTFGQHVAVELSSENKKQIFLPRGFAHGFIVLSEIATINYKVDNDYAPYYERGIAYDDKDLGINWILPKKNIKLSYKDQNYPTLSNISDSPNC